MTQKEVNRILLETRNTFGIQEWFRDAVVYPPSDPHPITGEPTLEFKVNYLPILGPSRKAIIEFAQQFNLRERFVVVDRQGRPAE